MSNCIKELAGFMRQQQCCFDNLANNIANASTDGFKRQLTVFRDGGMTIVTDMGKGTVQYTANPMDIRIEGGGFLAIKTPDGSIYTRKGNLTVDSDGELTTSEGYKVLGENGSIKVGGNEVSINEKGEVLQDGIPVGRLLIQNPQKGSNPIPIGKGYYYFEPDKMGGTPKIPGSGDNENTLVKSGELEGSNVNIINEMTKLITAVRNFEIAQKLMSARGEIYQKAVSELGKT